MSLIALFCPADAPRRELTLAIEELGHRVSPAVTMREAVDLLGAERPRAAVLWCAATDRLAETFLGETGRVAPLLPVVAALAARDATRAVELLQAGACEVVAPPYTRESLAACLAKALRSQGTSFEAVTPPQAVRRAGWYAAAVAGFLVIALGAAWVRHRREADQAAAAARRVPVVTEWELADAHPAGLTFHAGEFWVGDWFAQDVYRLDAAGLGVKRAVHLPGVAPVALAATGDALWTADPDGTVRRHMLDERLTVVGRPEDAFSRTVAMAYDGLYMWTVDGARNKLRKHLMDDRLTVLAVYDYPGVKAAALAFDGRTLWSIDETNRELLRHDINEPRLVTFKAGLREYQSGEWRPVGLAWDGAAFWSAAETATPGSRRSGRIFKHRVDVNVRGAS